MISLVECLICYTNAEASEYKFCNEHDGYNTCFASYDKGKMEYNTEFHSLKGIYIQEQVKFFKIQF